MLSSVLKTLSCLALRLPAPIVFQLTAAVSWSYFQGTCDLKKYVVSSSSIPQNTLTHTRAHVVRMPPGSLDGPSARFTSGSLEFHPNPSKNCLTPHCFFFFLTPLYCVAVDTIPLVFIFFFNEKTDAEISCCSKQLDTLSLRIVLCAGGRPREACAPLLGCSPH